MKELRRALFHKRENDPRYDVAGKAYSLLRKLGKPSKSVEEKPPFFSKKNLLSRRRFVGMLAGAGGYRVGMSSVQIPAEHHEAIASLPDTIRDNPDFVIDAVHAVGEAHRQVPKALASIPEAHETLEKTDIVFTCRMNEAETVCYDPNITVRTGEGRFRADVAYSGRRRERAPKNTINPLDRLLNLSIGAGMVAGATWYSETHAKDVKMTRREALKKAAGGAFFGANFEGTLRVLTRSSQ